MKKVIFVFLAVIVSGCNTSGVSEEGEAPDELTGVWEGSVSYTCTDRVLTDDGERVEVEIDGRETISLFIVDENGSLSGTATHSYKLTNPKAKNEMFEDKAEFDIEGKYAKPIANISTRMIRFDAGRDNNREISERDLEVEASVSTLSFETRAVVCQGDPTGEFLNDYTLEKK